MAIAAPAFATEPGTPMDCSDLGLAPELTCTEVTTPLEDRSFGLLPDVAMDNEGRTLSTGEFATEIIGSCGLTSLRRQAILVAFDSAGNRIPLVTATSRCLDPSARYVEAISALGSVFDAVAGSVTVHFVSRCQRTTLGPGCPFSGPAPSTFSENLSWMGRIDGFAPLADVLPAPLPLCSNGLDDDGDGDVDTDDAHCKSDADNDESRP